MATDRLLKLIERRAKMLGYDVPIKEEHAPVWHPASAEELERQRAILRRYCNFPPRAIQGTQAD
jgi:hypothetical protein